MVTDSNHWLIVAWWRQYFFIAYQNLPSETIGVPPLARAIVPSGTARKAAGDLQGLRPAGQTSAGLLVVLAFRRLLSGGTGVSRPENRCFLSSVPLENCAGGTIFALLREAAGKQELLTTLQRSARQAAAAGGLTMLFVRVSTISPQTLPYVPTVFLSRSAEV